MDRMESDRVCSLWKVFGRRSRADESRRSFFRFRVFEISRRSMARESRDRGKELQVSATECETGRRLNRELWNGTDLLLHAASTGDGNSFPISGLPAGP